MKNPMSVSQMYPDPWLKNTDLNGRNFTLTIKSVRFDTLYNNISKQKEPKCILVFEKAEKQLVLNKTQSFDIADALGTEIFAEWAGKSISLFPARSHNGKATISMRPAPAPKSPAPHTKPPKESAPLPFVRQPNNGHSKEAELPY